MQKYKYIPVTSGKKDTIKINLGPEIISLVGYKAKTFKKMKEQGQKLAVLGFIKIGFPSNKVNAYVTFKGKNGIYPLAVNNSHKNKVKFYFSVGSNRYIGIENPTFKELLEIRKTMKK